MGHKEQRVDGLDCGEEAERAIHVPEIETEDLESLVKAIRKSVDGRIEGSSDSDSTYVRPPEIRFSYDHLLTGVGLVATGVPKIYYVN